MTLLHGIAYLFAGAFVGNAIPHWVNGVSGRAFQTVFATPRGQGLSTSRLNVIWGATNAVVGYVLLTQVGAFDIRNPGHATIFFIGALLISLRLSRRFGRVNGGNAPKPGIPASPP
jgi:hypothetical protein